MKKNLIDAFVWAFNQIENRALTTVQQNALLHIINRLNRNMWKPVPIVPKALAASMSVDTRTATKAIDYLIKSGIITETQGGYDIDVSSQFPAKHTATRRQTSNRRASTQSNRVSDEDRVDESPQFRVFTANSNRLSNPVNESNDEE